MKTILTILTTVVTLSLYSQQTAPSGSSTPAPGRSSPGAGVVQGQTTVQPQSPVNQPGLNSFPQPFTNQFPFNTFTNQNAGLTNQTSPGADVAAVLANLQVNIEQALPMLVSVTRNANVNSTAIIDASRSPGTSNAFFNQANTGSANSPGGGVVGGSAGGAVNPAGGNPVANGGINANGTVGANGVNAGAAANPALNTAIATAPNPATTRPIGVPNGQPGAQSGSLPVAGGLRGTTQGGSGSNTGLTLDPQSIQLLAALQSDLQQSLGIIRVLNTMGTLNGSLNTNGTGTTQQRRLAPAPPR